MLHFHECSDPVAAAAAILLCKPLKVLSGGQGRSMDHDWVQVKTREQSEFSFNHSCVLAGSSLSWKVMQQMSTPPGGPKHGAQKFNLGFIKPDNRVFLLNSRWALRGLSRSPG